MSDYPHAPPYGASYGGQHPTNASYPPPIYPNQPYQQVDDSQQGHPTHSQYTQNYDTSMNAYGYNHQSIPGYSGAAALVPGAAPLPIYQGWNQENIPLPPYTAPPSAVPYQSYGSTSYNAPHYPPVDQHSYQHNTQYSNPVEEGERSEGEFDNAYIPTNPAPLRYNSTQYHGASGSGYMGAAQRAVYDKTPDYRSQQQHTGNDYYSQEPSQLVPQPPDPYNSYDPVPRAIDQSEHPGGIKYKDSYAPSHLSGRHTNNPASKQNHLSGQHNVAGSSSRPSSRVDGNNALRPQEISARHVTTPGPVLTTKFPPTTVKDTATSALPAPPPAIKQLVNAATKSLVEARKEAQGAVLNLYPFQVRFQTFMDEGFDEAIVGGVFDDLGLARTSSKSANGLRSALNTPPAGQTLTIASSGVPISDENLAPISSGSQADSRARASKQVPAHAGLKTSLSEKHSINKPSSPSTSTVPEIPAKAPTKTEKERKLQEKMEALRKSREQRAQKAAAKSDTAAPAPTTATPQLATTAKSPVQAEGTNSIPPPNLPKPSATTTSQPPASDIPLARIQIPVHLSSSPSVALPANKQQGSAIPGLFLAPQAGSPAPIASPHNTIHGSANGSQRKRPVAADFDTPTVVPASKRPFGQSRYETSLVIDVSDEEPGSDDEDVAMELESSVDHNSPVQAARKMSDHRSTAIQNLPLLTNFPGRKPFTPPPMSSAASTPPARKTTLGNPEVLQEKEMAIEILRKKIADAEAAKALKKGKQTPSGARTPRTTDSSGDDTKAINEDLASKVEASVQMQQMISIAQNEVNLDQKRLADAQAAEVEKIAELERNELDQKRLRREQIATDLPRVDAEVVQSQLKLEQLRSEIAKIEVAVQKNLEEKQKMAEEMERLGQEAEDRLQAQKAKLRYLTSAEPMSITDSPLLVHFTTDKAGAKQTPIGTISSGPARSTATSPFTQIDKGPTLPVPNDNINGSAATPQSGMGDVEADHVLEAALQEAVRAEADKHAEERATRGASIDDMHAQDPNQALPESESSPMDIDSRSPPYSPVLERIVTATSERDDEYEPPEATPPVDVRSPTASPPFSPAPPESDNGVELKEQETFPQSKDSPGLQEKHPAKLHEQTKFFTPYESPLKLFGAFRFHPRFDENVAGGLRSLTYSHKIDPMAELCPWEMAGGACNDSTCEYQHMRDIRIPDDDILKFLGSQDYFTGEQRSRYVAGLRVALHDIRERQIRDFESIAKEIIAYRRNFLGDDSKVLALENVSV